MHEGTRMGVEARQLADLAKSREEDSGSVFRCVGVSVRVPWRGFDDVESKFRAVREELRLQFAIA
jgi:hypothetical protein